MKTIEETKLYLKEHKKEILIGVATVIGGVAIVVTKKKLKGMDADKIRKVVNPKLVKLDVTDSLRSKGIYELSSNNPDKYVDIWFDNAPLSELGNIGKELSECLNLDPEIGISGVLGVKTND